MLSAHRVPFDSIEDCEPRRSWEETNAELYSLLIQLSGADGPEEVGIFSHYLISETNLLFDRLLRIRALVERDRPSTLAIGAVESDTTANNLHDAAAHLSWPANLQIRRWNLQGPLNLV